jgi:Integrase zinc binding domain
MDFSVLYIDPLFEAILWKSAYHSELGHISYPNIASAIELGRWWPALEADLRRFNASCLQCQVTRRQCIHQEREPTQLATDQCIQLFQRWGTEPIALLPETRKGNHWIITPIDYATGWPIAKALQSATSTVITDFIHDEIYMYYGGREKYSLIKARTYREK